MDIRFGCPVYSRDEKKVGELHEVVVDPISRELTHFVLRQGLFFSDDRVLPITLIDEATPQAITLTREAEELKEQSGVYDQQSFATVPGSESDLPQRIWTQPPGHNTVIPPGFRPQDLAPDPPIPMEDVSLLQNSPVHAVDGAQVGSVQQVFADSEDRITHLVMRCTGVYDEYKLLPLDWIRSFEDNTVYLGVEEGVVRQLSDYEAPPSP